MRQLELRQLELRQLELRQLELRQIACGMIGFRRGLAAGLMAAGLLAIASPSAAQQGTPPPPEPKTAVGDGKVLLEWSGPYPEDHDDWDGPAADRYEYRIRPAGGTYPSTWTRIPDVEPVDDSYLYPVETLADGTALSNGTAYFFEMRSVNTLGAGAATEEFPPEDEGEYSTPVANTPATYEIDPGEEVGRILRIPAGTPIPRIPAQLGVSLYTAVDDADYADNASRGDPRFTWRWQWIRVKDGIETEIPDGTDGGLATAYRLTAADEGSQIKARMRFRDDAYNLEEWVSPLFPESGAILPPAACRAPNLAGGRTLLWSEEELDLNELYESEGGVSAIRGFGREWVGGYTAGDYSISEVLHATRGTDAGKLVLKLEAEVSEEDQRQLALHVCDEVYPLIRDRDPHSNPMPRDDYKWWPVGTGWSDLPIRTLHLSRDTGPPMVESVQLAPSPFDGSLDRSMFITFDEELGNKIPSFSGFTVEVDGSPVELESTTLTRDGIYVTPAEPLPASYSTLTLAYTVLPDALHIEDPAWNKTLDFEVGVPYNGTPPPPPPPSGPPEFLSTPYVFELPEGHDGSSAPVALGTVEASDPDGGSVVYELVASGDSSRFAVDGSSGAVTYVGPGENLDGGPGRYELTVQAEDSDGDTATASVEIRVTAGTDPQTAGNDPPPAGNDPPLAVDDAAQTPEDTPVTIAVLENDSDPDGDPLTVTEVSAPAHGTAAPAAAGAGAVRYTPEPNFNGTDRFTYVVRDGSGQTARAAVEVTVLPVDDPPLAVDDAAQTAEDTAGDHRRPRQRQRPRRRRADGGGGVGAGARHGGAGSRGRLAVHARAELRRHRPFHLRGEQRVGADGPGGGGSDGAAGRRPARGGRRHGGDGRGRAGDHRRPRERQRPRRRPPDGGGDIGAGPRRRAADRGGHGRVRAGARLSRARPFHLRGGAAGRG